MRPLMLPEMHHRLSDLHERLVQADGGSAQVFVPVAPPEEAGPRLLFIGQATRDWADPDMADYEKCWRRSAEIVGDTPRRSGFWQVLRKIVTDVCAEAAMPDLTGRLSEVVGWSNLVKVGHPDRNPGAASVHLQAELCVEQLRHELEMMRPSAVVVMTRDFAKEEILLPVFGASGWTNDVPEEDRAAWKLAPMPVVWMNHPRNMGPAGHREGSIKTAVSVICKHLAS